MAGRAQAAGTLLDSAWPSATFTAVEVGANTRSLLLARVLGAQTHQCMNRLDAVGFKLQDLLPKHLSNPMLDDVDLRQVDRQ